jgi:DNA polymerase elongation subunit (family B)
MSEFYTHVYADRRGIYYRGYSNNQRVKELIKDYSPSLFVPTNKPTPYKTVFGQDVQRIKFSSISEAQDFASSNDTIEHDYVYGNTRWSFAYISDKFEDGIDFDMNLIRKATIDIETDSSKGFADPSNAFAPIISITLKYRDKFYVFGVKPFKSSRVDVRYFRAPDEKEMLLNFIEYWQRIDFDILFGWNTDQYDIPYIINRIIKVFHDPDRPKYSRSVAEKLSPWGKIRDTAVNFRGKRINTYDIVGIISLDYIDLYRRYMPKAESDSLKFVADLELGETKVEYDGTLHDLYTKDYDKFIEYNVQDVALVEKLDAKLKLADVVITTAYDSLCNFSDVQQQVRMWDAISFNELKKRKVVIPPIKEHDKNEQYEGAFVLPAQTGKHKWVVNFDFASLYPSLIREHNISPDTFGLNINTVLNGREITYDEEGMISRTEDLSVLKKVNMTCSGAGWLFDRDKSGFLGDIMKRLFDERMIYKNKMKEAQKKAVSSQNVDERRKYESDAIKFNNFQSAKKIQLNAAYGSLGSKYFRFYNPELARSVTLSGRAVLLTVKDKITKSVQEKYKIDYDPIIYGDTDSLYISAKPFVDQLPSDMVSAQIVDCIDKQFCAELYGYIGEALEVHRDRYNTFTRQLEMVRDVIAEDTIFVSKKRYLMEIWDKEGTRYPKPKRKATGLEMIKSTTSKYCKQWLNSAADVILKGNVNDLQVLVDSYRKEFETLSLEMISYPINVSDIENYVAQLSSKAFITFEETIEVGERKGLKKSTPVQVAAAFTYNRFLEENNLTKKYDKIKSGQRMRFFYLKEQNPFKSHVMGMFDKVPKELDLKQWIDYEAQFEKVFVKPLNILLRAVKWREIGSAASIMNIFDD